MLAGDLVDLVVGHVDVNHSVLGGKGRGHRRGGHRDREGHDGGFAARPAGILPAITVGIGQEGHLVQARVEGIAEEVADRGVVENGGMVIR